MRLCAQGEVSAEQQKSKKLAKRNTQLKQERDTAKRTAMAVSVSLRRMIENRTAAERVEALRKTEAFPTASASEAARVTPGTHPTSALPCSTSWSSPPVVSIAPLAPSACSSHSCTTARAKKPDGASSNTIVGFPLRAVDLTTREPFSDSSNQQLVVQVAATQSMLACRLTASSVVPREREACCTPTGLDAKENVQPASCVFTFSSRRPPCLDTRKLVCLSHIHSSAEAVPSPVNRQSLYLTTATEAYDHVSMRGKGEANARRARFGRLAPTAPEANTINTGHRVQALVTAAKAASSVASNDLPLVPSPVNRQSLYPTTATEASNHVSMRYTDEAKACHAQFSRSAPTAPEANNINTGHRVQALVTAAKPASSVASNSLLPLVPSPVNRQSLYLTTATEASNRVSMRYTDEAKACHAQFSRSAPTAPEANNINTGNRVQALVTAAKVASSVARNSLLPLAVIGADTSESSCTSSAANVKYHITTNMAATIEDCGGCHAPTAKNVHMKDSIAAIR